MNRDLVRAVELFPDCNAAADLFDGLTLWWRSYRREFFPFLVGLWRRGERYYSEPILAAVATGLYPRAFGEYRFRGPIRWVESPDYPFAGRCPDDTHRAVAGPAGELLGGEFLGGIYATYEDAYKGFAGRFWRLDPVDRLRLFSGELRDGRRSGGIA